MRSYTLLILVLLLVFSVVQSCKKDDVDCGGIEDPETIYLGDDTTKIPYTGVDTIRFKYSDTSGNILDTITIVGQGRKYSYKYLGEKLSSSKNGCTVGVRGEKYDVQYANIQDGKTFMNHTVLATRSEGRIFVDLNGAKRDFLLTDISNNLLSGYRPNVIINGDVYYKVNVLTSPSELSIDTLYINEDIGIFRIVDGDTILDLIP